MLKDFLSKSVALETQTLMQEGPKSITHALKPITRLFSLGAKPSGKVIWQKYFPNVHLKSLSFDYSITNVAEGNGKRQQWTNWESLAQKRWCSPVVRASNWHLMKQEQLKQTYNYLNHEANTLNDHELVFGHVKTFITTLNIYMKWIQKKLNKKKNSTLWK